MNSNTGPDDEDNAPARTAGFPKRPRSASFDDGYSSSSKNSKPSRPRHPQNKKQPLVLLKPGRKRANKSEARKLHSKAGSTKNKLGKIARRQFDEVHMGSVDVDTTPVAAGGWQGSRGVMRSVGDWVRSLWSENALGPHLKNFILVPFKEMCAHP